MKHIRDAWPIYAIVAVIVAMLWACVLDTRRCEAAGGHLHSVYKSTICVSSDGRIIE